MKRPMSNLGRAALWSSQASGAEFAVFGRFAVVSIDLV